jgi:hypothetical protein
MYFWWAGVCWQLLFPFLLNFFKEIRTQHECFACCGQVLEIPLRTAVMVSQVYAGMWRRNGYSLQHQIFFYHNAR